MEITSNSAQAVVLALPELLGKIGKEEFRFKGKGGVYHLGLMKDGKVSGSVTSKPRGNKSAPTATWADRREAETDLSKFGTKVSLSVEEQTKLRKGETLTYNGCTFRYDPKVNAKEPFIVSGRPSKVSDKDIVATFSGTPDEIASLVFDKYRS